jgi:4-hydroxyphenylpyruvate dioxygenase
MIPTLSQVCSLPSPLAADLDEYAAGQCHSVELWLTKVEEFLKSHDAADVVRLLQEHELAAPVASFQGGLLDSQGEARREAWQLLGRRIELCRGLGVGTLVVACDVAGPLGQQAIERVQASLAQLGRQMEAAGLRAALEFQARSALGNNLQTAAALVREAGSPALGLCLDAFHYYTGPSKPDDLGLLTGDNLFHVQLSDLADVPREFAADSDRILPGDGDIQLAPVLARLREIGYAGAVSVEVLNPQLWQVPPLQFGEIALTALRKLLGLAEGGG